MREPEEYGFNDNEIGWVGRYFRIIKIKIRKCLDGYRHDSLMTTRGMQITIHVEYIARSNNCLVAHEQVGLCDSPAACLHVNASSPSQRGGHLILSDHPVVGPALLRNRVPILLESISGCDRCSALRIRYDAHRGLRETQLPSRA